MKSDRYLLAAGALLLVWSMRGEAHDSQEAMMAGGNLTQLAHALIHPVWEIPYPLPVLLIGTLILGLVLCSVILHKLRRENSANPHHLTIMEKPAIAPKTHTL